MTIARRVRDGRYAKGWGPEELAKRAAISRTALYQIECGRTGKPRAATLKRIARALDMPIESLLGVEGSNGHARHEAADGARPRRMAVLGPRRIEPRPEANGPGVREGDLAVPSVVHQKLDELLASPLREGIVQIVLQSHRLLAEGRNSLVN